MRKFSKMKARIFSTCYQSFSPRAEDLCEARPVCLVSPFFEAPPLTSVSSFAAIAFLASLPRQADVISPKVKNFNLKRIGF